MATRFSLPALSDIAPSSGDLARRLELAREVEENPASRPKLWRVLGEFEFVAEPVRRLFRRFDIAEASEPQIVLILPGFGANPAKMRYLAKALERAGHKTKRWGLGWNWGATEDSLDRLEERLAEVCERYNRKVVLLGWSLGGLYARELAKRQPDCISKVITMGSPFSGSPKANNAWRVYQFITGHRVEAPPIEADLAKKPPVETVALWSPLDGVISPRSAAGFPDERDRAIALRCTHMGFSYSREAVHTVLRELEAI